jgi:competence protein ComEC
MLFTGDAGISAERRFLAEGVDLRADVLKVGHHGSAYSSSLEFIAAVHPRYAIISVGRHNLFGHPAPSTIGTLQHFGVTVYRTDENGAVTVITNGAAPTAQPTIQDDTSQRRRWSASPTNTATKVSTSTATRLNPNTKSLRSSA